MLYLNLKSIASYLKFSIVTEILLQIFPAAYHIMIETMKIVKFYSIAVFDIKINCFPLHLLY